MTISLLGTFTGVVLGWSMGLLSLFLILLILIQRGKGGGLTGALGGPGGQSAFGSKAGDTFTRITIVVALIWGSTCAVTMLVLGTRATAVVTRTSISPGPGDEEVPSDSLVVPSTGGGGIGAIGDLSGIGGLDEDTTSTESDPGSDTESDPEQTEQTEQPDQTEQTEQPEQTEQAEQAEQADADQSDPSDATEASDADRQ